MWMQQRRRSGTIEKVSFGILWQLRYDLLCPGVFGYKYYVVEESGAPAGNVRVCGAHVSFQAVCLSKLSRYASVRFWYERDRKSVVCLSGANFCILALSVELFWLLEAYNVDSGLRIFEIVLAIKINFSVAKKRAGFHSVSREEFCPIQRQS